jgi:predicted DNA-binding protein
MFNKGVNKMGEEQEEEGLTAFIGIRIWPSFKKDLQELAAAGGQTLSELILEFIEAGWKKMEEEYVKEGSEKR